MQPDNPPQQAQPFNVDQPQNLPQPSNFWFLPRSTYIRYALILGVPITIALLFSTFTFSLLSLGTKTLNDNTDLIAYFHETSQPFRSFIPEQVVNAKLIGLLFALTGISISNDYKYSILTLSRDYSKLHPVSTGFLGDSYNLFEQQIQTYSHALGIISLNIETITQPVVVIWIPDELKQEAKNAYLINFPDMLIQNAFPGVCLIQASKPQDLKLESILGYCIEQINIAKDGTAYPSLEQDQIVQTGEGQPNRRIEQNLDFGIDQGGENKRKTNDTRNLLDQNEDIRINTTSEGDEIVQLLYGVITSLYKYIVLEFDNQEITKAVTEDNPKKSYRDFVEFIQDKGFRMALYQFVFERNIQPIIIIWRPELVGNKSTVETEFLIKLVQEVNQRRSSIPMVTANSAQDICLLNLLRTTTLASQNGDLVRLNNNQTVQYLKTIWNIEEEGSIL